MKVIVADTELVAYCGLYCGACRSYLRGRCPGCHEKENATWCTVRTCCREAKLTSCAECPACADPKDCRKFYNYFSRTIGFFLRSDRPACIAQIKSKGLRGHAKDMALHKRQTIRP
jgi:hypothetical protein